jgi:hypothetical protein
MQGRDGEGDYLHCFVHIEKCGGSTHINMLRKSLGLRHVDLIPLDRRTEVASKTDVEWALKLYPQAVSLAGHSIRPFGQFGQLRERMRFYTILRNPIQRYASDYLNDCRSRGYSGNLSDWTTSKRQHNIQVDSLSSRGSVSEAKEVLERDMVFFDILENYDQLVLNLRQELLPLRFNPKYVVKNVSDKKLGNAISGDEHMFSDAELELIVRANSKDVELYQWASEFLKGKAKTAVDERVPFAEKPLDGLTQSLNMLATKVFRNLVYKPTCGLMPMEVDVLPRYRSHAASYAGTNHMRSQS